MTLHYINHFILKIFDGLNFYDINNLKNFIRIPNNSNQHDGNLYMITYVFYEKF